MKEVTVTAAPGISELIIRQGEAPKIIEPRGFTASGLIATPYDFYKGRTTIKADHFDKSKAVVEVDRLGYKIVFRADPYSPLGDVVSGSMAENPALADYQINGGTNWKPIDLAQFLNRRRMYFADIEKGRDLVAALRSVKVSTQGEIEVSNDQRGNTKNLFEQSVKTNIPVSFVLKMPLFKGCEDVQFTVEIYLAVSGNVLYCSLESVELDEQKKAQIDKYIDAQIKGFVEDQITVIEV